MTDVGVIAASPGGVENIRAGLIAPLIDRGHLVAVPLTPTAARWLLAIDEVDPISRPAGPPVRWESRLPGERSQHPKIDLHVAAPLTTASTAKLSLGMADNQALTTLCESITTVPMIVFPRINAAHSRQPSWSDHLTRLRSVGVHLVYGSDV